MERTDDTNYFAERARKERDIASICEDNSVAIVHLRLAEEYDKKAIDKPETLRIVRDI